VMPLTDGRKPLHWSDMRTPLLVVEVLSPHSMRRDRVVKRQLYGKLGIEYWVADIQARSIERYMPRQMQPEIHIRDITWAPVGLDERVTIDVQALFASALDT
jgi:Uma2 family endonuclease